MRCLVLGLLLGCGATQAPAPEDAAAPVLEAATAYSDQSPEASPPAGPCGRTEALAFDGGAWRVRLPCRPFDRLRDTPDPQPK